MAQGFNPAFGFAGFPAGVAVPGFGHPVHVWGRQNAMANAGAARPRDELESIEAREKARETAVAKIGEILTQTQKEAFDRLLGPPMGAAKLEAEKPAGNDERPSGGSTKSTRTRLKSRRGLGE